MSKHTLDTMTTAALLDLDPAPTIALTDEELERAGATAARILATPRDHHVPEECVRSRRRRSRPLVPVVVSAAGAAVAAALLLTGGSAFASWTPRPEPLTSAAATGAATTCRATLEVRDKGERVVVAERRGGWAYVLISGARAELACLMPDDLVGHQESADHTQGRVFGGYTADPVEAPTLARDRIVETESMAGSVPTRGRWPFRDHEGWFSSVQGYVGSDVTGVTVHTPVGPDVEASVGNGRFAAWWPSDRPSSEKPEAMGAWTYTVTLADGGTRRVTG